MDAEYIVAWHHLYNIEDEARDWCKENCTIQIYSQS